MTFKDLNINLIIQDICLVFNIELEKFLSKRKGTTLCSYRHIFYYITVFFDRKQMSTMDISRAIDRDHSTIIKQRRLIGAFIDVNDEHFMKSLAQYQEISPVYKIVENYYQSKGKTLDYGKAFAARHKKRVIE